MNLAGYLADPVELIRQGSCWRTASPTGPASMASHGIAWPMTNAACGESKTEDAAGVPHWHRI